MTCSASCSRPGRCANCSWKRSDMASSRRSGRSCSRTIDGAVDIDNINELVARNKLTQEGLDPATVRGVREAMERAAARRLQPHHIRSFFEAAFAEAGGRMRPRANRGVAEVTRVPPLLRDRDRLIGRGDPVLQRYRRICFDKAYISPANRRPRSWRRGIRCSIRCST